MRKIKSVLLALALCASIFSSCKKDDGDNASDMYLSAKVDGTFKEGKDSKVGVVSQAGLGVVIVGTFGTATETISLVLPENPTAREYNLMEVNAAVDAEAMYTNGTADLNVFDAESGSIKVTAVSATSIEGTFNFVAKNDANASKTVTEGKFKVKRK